MDNIIVMVATRDMVIKNNWVVENAIDINPFNVNFDKNLRYLYVKYREMWDADVLCVQFRYKEMVFYEIWLSEMGIEKVQHYLITGIGDSASSVPYYATY